MKRRLSLRHVEAFRAVIATGSMTEAARRLHTSQPQISRLIQQLEGITGFPLFHRKGSRLSPTLDAGRFSQEVEKTFSGLAGLEAAAARIRSFGSSRLSVAAMPRLASGVLARAVARFRRDYPTVLVSIHSGDAAAVQHWVSSGACEVGVAMIYGEVSDVLSRRIMALNCVAILPIGHDLANATRVRAEDFDGQNFVAFSTGSSIRARVDEALSLARAEPVIVAEASLGASVCALVAAGLGASVINPLAAVEESVAANIEVRPFSPAIPLSVVLLFPRHSAQSRLIETFARCAADVIHEEFERLG